MKQNYINHVALVLDASGSMQRLISTVATVADLFIQHLAARSKELDQETRVTVYQFSGPSDIQCLVYDKDVLRLPSIRDLYNSLGGMTALLDATLKALADLKQTAQLYGDHAFLTYVLTDGQENNSVSRFTFRAALDTLYLNKDNWTLALFVPDQLGKGEAMKFGFPSANIAIWDTTVQGITEVGRVIRQTTDTYMTNRAKGVRGTKNLFQLATDQLDRVVVQATTNKLGPGQFRFIPIADEVGQSLAIADVIERRTGRPYRLGEAYYQLTKRETIQPQKAIALYDRKAHSVFTGPSTRQLLGLPENGEVKVSPENHSQYDIYVQSTSVNRKLVPGTSVLVLS